MTIENIPGLKQANHTQNGIQRSLGPQAGYRNTTLLLPATLLLVLQRQIISLLTISATIRGEFGKALGGLMADVDEHGRRTPQAQARHLL